MKKINVGKIIMSIIMISFPCAILVGVMSDYFALPKWTDNVARVLFVLGLIAVPALFFNLAYEQRKNKKLAFQTIAFAIVMAIVALPLIVMLLKGLS